MSRRRKPDILFTNDVQVVRKSPCNYDSQRRKNLRIAFGGVALALGVTAVLFFRYRWALPVAILGIVFSIVAFGVRTHRRDIGFHCSRVGMLASAIAIGAGLMLMLYQGADKLRKELANEAESTSVDRLIGIWKLKDPGNDITLEFTKGGNVIRSQRYWQESSPNDIRTSEAVGKYSVNKGNLKVWKSDMHSSRAIDRMSPNHSWEILASGEMMIAKTQTYSSFQPLTGRWIRIGPDPGEKAQPKNLSEKVGKYAAQLKDFSARRSVLVSIIEKYEADKNGVLSRIKQHQDAGKPIDDSWRILAREVKTLNRVIDDFQEQVAALDNVIVRLQAVIRTEGRQEEINELNMSDNEMTSVLKTTFELDDKLQINRETELLEDSVLQDLMKKEASGNDE